MSDEFDAAFLRDMTTSLPQEESKLDEPPFGIPIPLQILLSMTDPYAKDFCNVLDAASSRPMTWHEQVRYNTALFSIDFGFFHRKAVSFALPPHIPATDTFFARLPTSKRLQIQVASLIRHKKELFVQTNERAKVPEEWLAVRRDVADKLNALADWAINDK